VQDEKLLVREASEQDSNALFTVEERGRIHLAIGEIRVQLVSVVGTNAEQLAYIDARLQHLEEASERLGRKDWINMAVGIITNIVIGVSLAPEAARDLFQKAGTLLAWVGQQVAQLAR
jgi:hypothetical protein